MELSFLQQGERVAKMATLPLACHFAGTNGRVTHVHADSKTQMATEFSYVVGVNEKICCAAILAPVAKGPFSNKKWQLPLELA
jgi:hypothetical protein